MNWRIEEKEAFEVVGISRFFKNDESGKIPAWWDETYAEGSRIKLTEKLGYDDLIGVCYYADEKADGFRYMIGLFVREGADTSGFETIKIPKTTWAIFRSGYADRNFMGSEIPKLFQRAYTEWLPSSGYDKASGPDMEIYGITDGGADGSVKFYEEVWLPVIKKA